MSNLMSLVDWKGLGISFLVLLSSILLLCLLVFITILLYINFSKKRKRRWFNIKFIAILFLIVFIVHVICVFLSLGDKGEWSKLFQDLNDNNNLRNCISHLLKIFYTELYSTLGGLTFEGQEIDASNFWITSIYFLSIIWLAVTNAILIVIGISFTIYSNICLLVLRYQKGIDIYIFTYTTEQSLILADNIIEKEIKTRKETYKKRKLKNIEKNVRKKVKIIFSSDELEPFDKNNPIHCQIMDKNYLYIPLNKKDIKRRHSIIENLFDCTTSLYKNKLLKVVKNNNFSIFALKIDKNLEGFESKNNDIVFDDIKLFLKHSKDQVSKKINKNSKESTIYEKYKDECQKIEWDIDTNTGTKRNIFINYYILSNNNPNFEFYENSLKQIFKKYFDDNEINDICLFNLSVLNEALMSAENLLAEIHKNYNLDEPLLNYYNGEPCINYLENGYKSLVIGFGQNGQRAIEQLYLDSNGGRIEKDTGIFIPNKFFAEIIDTKIDEIIGSYISTHPSFVFNSGDIREIEDCDSGCYKKLFERYSEKYSKENFKNIIKYMAFPQFFYKNQNYNNPSFINTINDICERKYDSIVISLGDDEENIKCANSIIQSLKQCIGVKNNYETKRLQIFVNIKDHNNNARLQWYEVDQKLSPKVFVYHFGNLIDIYSSNIFINKGAALVNKIYKQIGEGKNINGHWIDEYINGTSMYEKKTNESVYNYGSLYEKYLKFSKIPSLTANKTAYDLINEEYQIYKEIISDGKSMEDYLYDKKPYKKKGVAHFDRVIEKTLLKNLSDIDEIVTSNEKKQVKVNFANFRRINYDGTSLSNYFWRYLIQFEHSRWCRHMMIYGRTFTNVYAPKIYIQKPKDYKEMTANELKDEKRLSKANKNYWKNILKLHTCLLPYSKEINLKTNVDVVKNMKYLRYQDEDYDYGCVVVALNLEMVNENQNIATKRIQIWKIKLQNMPTSATQKETKHQ